MNITVDFSVIDRMFSAQLSMNLSKDENLGYYKRQHAMYE